MVLPIGPLMIEHRLIERMISLMDEEIVRLEEEHTINPEFIDTAVDFIRSYADRCHHGKEEKILFRDLKEKILNDDDQRIMDELIQEHVWGRQTTGSLVEAKNHYLEGKEEAFITIIDLMKQLVEFYPKHIKKEDKHFFKNAMKYLTQKEKNAMLDEEYEFDRNFIHQLYKDRVSQLESSN
jgi:hemerythrin-like domain-containing protein